MLIDFWGAISNVRVTECKNVKNYNSITPKTVTAISLEMVTRIHVKFCKMIIKFAKGTLFPVLIWHFLSEVTSIIMWALCSALYENNAVHALLLK